MTDAAELVNRLECTRDSLRRLADHRPGTPGLTYPSETLLLQSASAHALDAIANIDGVLAALAAQQDGAVTFDDEECYILFLLADTEARHLRGRNDAINALREKLLPAYRDWHEANPHKVHPHSALVCEQLEQLRRDEQ